MQFMRPRVSVIVPTFNGGAWIADTLRAVQAQRIVAQVEIIVVDDGSSDGTPQVAVAACPQVRLLHQQRGGVSRARNRGLAEAQGDFICFLDQDDRWHPLQLERQLALMDARPEVGAVATPYRFWWPAEDPDPMLPPDTGPQLVPGYEGWTYHLFLRDCWALTSATMVRKSLLSDLGGFDADRPYAEDWDLWLRLSHRAPFAQLAWPPVLYRQHADQGSRTVRMRDHRVELLMAAAQTRGLASPDGQALPAAEFKAIVARYRMEFGYHHAQHGDRWMAARSLLMAWWMQPACWRRAALALAVGAGWRPRPANQWPAGLDATISAASLSAHRPAAAERPAAEK